MPEAGSAVLEAVQVRLVLVSGMVQRVVAPAATVMVPVGEPENCGDSVAVNVVPSSAP